MQVIDQDEETVLQSSQCPSTMDSAMNAFLHSSHREWAEEFERRQQDQERQAVERFLQMKLKQKAR